MKKIVRLTESDLMRIVKRVINEQNTPTERDFISLKCASLNPNDSRAKMIEHVIYSEYLEKSDPLPAKLILKRPSDLPSNEVFSTGGDSVEYNLNIELVTGEVLKRALNITDDDTHVMTYNVGGRFYCTPKSKLTPTWEAFFRDKNIAV